MIDFQQETTESVAVYLLSVDEKETKDEEVAVFLDRFDIKSPIYRCDRNIMKTFFKNNHLNWEGEYPPLTVVLGGDGRLVEVLGITDANEINMIIHKDQSFRN